MLTVIFNRLDSKAVPIYHWCESPIQERFAMPPPSSDPEALMQLNQYYRDCLSHSIEFPEIGAFPRDFIGLALSGNYVDHSKLTELLLRIPPCGLPAEHETALKLMLSLLVQVNVVLSAQTPNPNGQRLPTPIIDSIKRGLQRVLMLHPNPAYFSNLVQLMFRLNQVADVVRLSTMQPQDFQRSGALRAIMGFISTLQGQYQQGLDLLSNIVPTSIHQERIIGLSRMTCQYFLGQTPSSPFSFASLGDDLDQLQGQISKRLPPLRVIHALENPHNLPVVFAACDSRYFFQHALHLAYSIDVTNRGALALHLHLYSPNPSVLAEVARLRQRLPDLAIGISAEDVGARDNTPVYYATARFIRAYQLFTGTNHNLCIIDADALFRRDWASFTGTLGEPTELVLAQPEHAPFWERIIAGFMYCKQGEITKNFLGRVSQFILRNMDQEITPWFTDQVALSVCDHRFHSGSPQVAHLPSEALIDVEHGPNSLTWAVTTGKSSHAAYNHEREMLGERYGQLAHSTPECIYQHISEKHGPIFFVQIGAMDGVSYDPIHPHVVKHGWKGLLVEPLPDMMAKLQQHYTNHPGLTFEMVAITEKEETRTLYRIPPEAAQQAGLPGWVAGMSTFTTGKLDDYKPHVREQPVTCMKLGTLLAKYNPPKIDVLQIDTEGYDYKILKQFDFARYKPLVINVELVNLDSPEKQALYDLLASQDYVFYPNEFDLFAVRRDILFPSDK